jgi:hypothetical protein
LRGRKPSLLPISSCPVADMDVRARIHHPSVLK